MKLEVEYMVEVLSEALKPVTEKGSKEVSKLDLTEKLGFKLEKVIFDSETRDLTIIAPDRPEKSAVIGKGGWVVGRLREVLNVNSIHVEAYSDMMVRIYRMGLALEKVNITLKSIDHDNVAPITNLRNLLNLRIEDLPRFSYFTEFKKELMNLKSQKPLKNNEMEYNINDHKAIVALSGGVDSSFSLILAKILGFNPLAVTIDPGNIILPSHFKKNIGELTRILNVPHEYIAADLTEMITESIEGNIHPCGRCSSTIEKTLLDYTRNSEIPFLIFGDFLATGTQSMVELDGIWRINLPAMLSTTKGETRSLSTYFDLNIVGWYGCPLINEVHKLHPHMRRFSIQRILRETRAGALEPGQALNLITRTL